MSVANTPPDHMEAKMRVQHIVQLNCQSAPLKIGHTAESSGGCGTQQGKRAFTGKQEKREILLKPQQSDDVNSSYTEEQIFKMRVE